MQSSISDPSMVPSAAPRLKAIPALVVAIAANPACSRIRAEPPSQAFGRMKPAPGRCIARNAAARFGVAEVSMRPILRLGERLRRADPATARSGAPDSQRPAGIDEGWTPVEPTSLGHGG